MLKKLEEKLRAYNIHELYTNYFRGNAWRFNVWNLSPLRLNERNEKV